MDTIPKSMSRDWGQFMETVTRTEYKAGQYDSQSSELCSLRKEVNDLRKKVAALEAEKQKNECRIELQDLLIKDQTKIVRNHCNQVKDNIQIQDFESLDNQIDELSKGLKNLTDKFNEQIVPFIDAPKKPEAVKE